MVAEADAKISQARMSISQLAIPNRFSSQPTIVSNAPNAKRRDNVASEKMHKNFSVGALFQNDNSLPAWMYRVGRLGGAQGGHGGCAKRRPAAPLTRHCLPLYVVGGRYKRGSRSGVGNGSSPRTAHGAGDHSGGRSDPQLLC